MKYLLLSVVFMAAVMVASCGMQGDLYLPEEDAAPEDATVNGTTQNQKKGS